MTLPQLRDDELGLTWHRGLGVSTGLLLAVAESTGFSETVSFRAKLLLSSCCGPLPLCPSGPYIIAQCSNGHAGAPPGFGVGNGGTSAQACSSDSRVADINLQMKW